MNINKMKNKIKGKRGVVIKREYCLKYKHVSFDKKKMEEATLNKMGNSFSLTTALFFGVLWLLLAKTADVGFLVPGNSTDRY